MLATAVHARNVTESSTAFNCCMLSVSLDHVNGSKPRRNAMSQEEIYVLGKRSTFSRLG